MSDSLQPCGLYVARQAPLSIGFSRQEYWSGLPFPSPGDLPNPGIKPRSAALQADSFPAESLKLSFFPSEGKLLTMIKLTLSSQASKIMIMSL